MKKNLTSNGKIHLEDFEKAKTLFLDSIVKDPINFDEMSRIDNNYQILLSFKDQFESLIEEMMNSNESTELLTSLFGANDFISETSHLFNSYKNQSLTFQQFRENLGIHTTQNNGSKDQSFHNKDEQKLEEDLNGSFHFNNSRFPPLYE